MKVYRFDEVESTNDEAKIIAEKGIKNLVVVLANFQSKGRGQFERKWLGEKNKNIYMSIVIKSEDINLPVSEISVYIGEILQKSLKDFGVESTIKLPNDIYVNGKKVAGILVETSYKPKLEYIIIGIGINVVQENFPDELKGKATSLLLENHSLEKESLIQNILDKIKKIAIK